MLFIATKVALGVGLIGGGMLLWGIFVNQSLRRPAYYVLVVALAVLCILDAIQGAWFSAVVDLALALCFVLRLKNR